MSWPHETPSGSSRLRRTSSRARADDPAWRGRAGGGEGNRCLVAEAARSRVLAVVHLDARDLDDVVASLLAAPTQVGVLAVHAEQPARERAIGRGSGGDACG